MALADKIELDFDTPRGLPDLGVYKVALHFFQVGFEFLCMCLAASAISTERAFYGSSQAALNYTLIVSLLSLFVSTPLAIFPWTRFAKIPCLSIRNFFLRLRTSLIFTCFFSFTWFIAMISMSLHLGNQSNCDLDPSMIKKYSSYQSAWKNQCNCARAVTAFSYLLFFLWMGTIACSVLLFWHEKKQKHIDECQANKSIKGERNSFEADGQTLTSTQDNKLENDCVPKQNSPIPNEDPNQLVCHRSPPNTANMSYSPLVHGLDSPYEGLQRPIATIIAPFTPSPLIMSPQPSLSQPYHPYEHHPQSVTTFDNPAYYSSPHIAVNLPYQSHYSDGATTYHS
ncbi:hypothetical protein BD560DRAFT_486989 [Blakeslea trispora]|nr:hypothetical protein BD560DRAFT_486989 [Blakeslea trispora]